MVGQRFGWHGIDLLDFVVLPMVARNDKRFYLFSIQHPNSEIISTFAFIILKGCLALVIKTLQRFAKLKDRLRSYPLC